MKHDKIQALDDRQKCRDKVSIWFGSRENFYHPIKEIIANSTDEIINNFDEGTIQVILHEDHQTITVVDTGRGIPIDGETDGVKNYELLFRTLFAGTKYEENDQITTGTNGVGNTVICFTSELFEVASFYNHKKYHMKFKNGGELVEDLTITENPNNVHGTIITFKLDNEIYPVITYDHEEIRQIAKRYAISSPKIKVQFIQEEKGETETFHYETIEEYFTELVGNTSTSSIVTLPECMYEEEKEKSVVKLVLTTTPEPIQEAYLNLTYLAEGGSINDGVIQGVKQFASKYCKDNRLFPKGITTFATSDIETSISFVCTVMSNNVEFQNQTKLSTNKKLYQKVVQKHTNQLLEIFSIENKGNLTKFINHLLTIQKHNSASLKAKQALKKKLSEKVDGIGNKVEQLVDCKKHGNEAEIFIAEGLSALGSIVLARDAIFQAAYPLRGKILNCLKTDYTTIFKNQIITDLIKALGCGIQTDKKNKDLENFDILKLRYGKIIIATDSDDDGYQIAALIITMFYRLMPDLLTKGYVYIAQTPLYEVKMSDDTMIYYYSESEKEEKLPSLQGKYNIARCKGLGELQPEVMSETAMEPTTRNLIRVTVDDAVEMTKAVQDWMGKDVLERKTFISENFYKYVENVE